MQSSTKKAYLAVSAALLLVFATNYFPRPVDMRRHIAGRWFTTSNDITQMTFYPSKEDIDSGSVKLHHLRWGTDLWRSYQFVAEQHIRLTGSGMDETWVVNVSSPNTIAVWGSSDGIYCGGRNSELDCGIAQSPPRGWWDGLKRAGYRMIVR